MSGKHKPVRQWDTARPHPLREELATLGRVKQITGMGSTYIYTQQGSADNPFPMHIKVGRRSMWVVSEVHDWVDRQIKRYREEQS